MSKLNVLSFRIAALALVATTVVAVSGRATAATLHVPGSYSTIQGAIDGAVSGQDQIEVAPGSYNEAINFKGKAVRLYSSGGRGVTTIDATGLVGVYHVVQCVSGEGPDTVLEGFTISGGRNSVSCLKVEDRYGAGMRNISSSPTVTNCVFTGNSAFVGGGMANLYYSSPTVTNCTFVGNSAVVSGGMNNFFGSSPTVTDCTFTGNWAELGGGMFNFGNAGATVTNCTFSGNWTENGDGGGIVAHFNEASSVTVDNCTFTGNSATGGGGGIFNFDGYMTVSNCTFSGNSALGGGGIGVLLSPTPNPVYGLTVSNCTFSGNSADLGGGICALDGWKIHCYGYDYPRVTVTNCAFSGNSAMSGGGITTFGGSPALTNCTFSNNTATESGGGMSNLHINSHSGNPTVVNCILWSDTPNEIDDWDDSITVSWSNVEGGWPGTGNIHSDPIFADADGRLLVSSPCIDAGDNGVVGQDTDLDGNPRITDGNGDGDARVDMGAYEYQKLLPPVADAGGPYEGIVGQPITFDASASYDPDGEIVWYAWDFDGDGKYEATASPTCEHTWQSEFSGTVALLVTDNDGMSATDSAWVEVTGVERTMSMELASCADLHVYDPKGRHLGVNYQTKSIEQNIPGASYRIVDEDGNEVPYDGNTSDEALRQVVNLPVFSVRSYRIVLIGTSDGPFHLTVNGVQDGEILCSKSYEGEIRSGECMTTNVIGAVDGDTLRLEFEALVCLPSLGVEPGELKVASEPGKVQEVVLVVGEMMGKATLHSVNIRCTNLVGREVTIKGSDVTFDLNNFDVGPGGQQVVHAFIPVPSDFREKVAGSILVQSADGGAKSIPVTIKPTKRYGPTADAGGPYEAIVGEPITFDGSGSYDPDGEIVWYGWDFDGDGRYEATGSATCEHTWDSEFSGTVTVLVTDDDGRGSIATATVVVSAP